MNTKDLLVLTLHPFNLRDASRSFASNLSLEDFKFSNEIKRARVVNYRYPNGAVVKLKEEKKRKPSF